MVKHVILIQVKALITKVIIEFVAIKSSKLHVVTKNKTLKLNEIIKN